MATYNEKLINEYKDYDKVIMTSYQVVKNGKLLDVSGILNPITIDNRQLCAPTDNQGAESSCAAFSIANICEAMIWKKTGRLVNLNAHQIYAKAKTLDGSMNTDGTYLECAIKAAFDLGGLPVPDLKIGFLENDGTPATIEAMKFLVHKYDFVHCGFNITTGWYDCNQKNYMINSNGAVLGGHAVICCGYSPEGFFIQNSWGKTWGSIGFGVLSEPDLLKSLIYACYIEL